LADLRTFDDGLEDAAEPAAVATTGRCGKAEHDRVGIGVYDFPICFCGTVMAFVDDEQIGRR
jgi:hypothetical protein